MDRKDFVFMKEKNGQLLVGGYKINSKLFDNQMAFKTMNNMSGGSKQNSNNDDGKVSSLFNNLAVPAGLLYFTDNILADPITSISDGVIDDLLYDRLLEKVQCNVESPTISHKKTRRRYNTPLSKRKTKRSQRIV